MVPNNREAEETSSIKVVFFAICIFEENAVNCRYFQPIQRLELYEI